MGDISGVPLAKSFEFESLATSKDAAANHIPMGMLDLEPTSEESIAELIAFWHYVAVYSSWLRDVDPFDQPHVEKSKEISFEMRRNA